MCLLIQNCLYIRETNSHYFKVREFLGKLAIFLQYSALLKKLQIKPTHFNK